LRTTKSSPRQVRSVISTTRSGKSVWAAAGRDRKTVERFFDELGEQRCKQIGLVHNFPASSPRRRVAAGADARHFGPYDADPGTRPCSRRAS